MDARLVSSRAPAARPAPRRGHRRRPYQPARSPISPRYHPDSASRSLSWTMSPRLNGSRFQSLTSWFMIATADLDTDCRSATSWRMNASIAKP